MQDARFLLSDMILQVICGMMYREMMGPGAVTKGSIGIHYHGITNLWKGVWNGKEDIMETFPAVALVNTLDGYMLVEFGRYTYLMFSIVTRCMYKPGEFIYIVKQVTTKSEYTDKKVYKAHINYKEKYIRNLGIINPVQNFRLNKLVLNFIDEPNNIIPKMVIRVEQENFNTN